jgi:recombination protein RecR
MQSKIIKKLIILFSNFPTVGPRTAARFVYYLLKLPEEKIKDIIFSISELKTKIKICKFCFSFFEPPRIILEKTDQELCEICQDNKRDKTLLCIIEKETDLISIEKTKKYKGLYFVLGDIISKFKKEKKELRINDLLERIKKSEIKEIIIALNSTSEGETTALYLEKLLKPFNKKITRLGRGLPLGSELEYADEETLSSALETRR